MATNYRKTYRANHTNSMSYTEIQADFSRKFSLGCVAAHGHFHFDRENSRYEVHSGGKPATAFLFKLISLLQFSGTVPMIDVKAYSAWLTK